MANTSGISLTCDLMGRRIKVFFGSNCLSHSKGNLTQWKKNPYRMDQKYRDRRNRMDLQLPMQSVPITTNVVSLNGEMHSIQHYMIKFVSDL